MKHFFTTKVKAVLIAAVLLAAVLAVVSNLTGRSVPDILVQDILAPLRAGANSLTLQAERIYDYIFGYEMLEAENSVLKEELAANEPSVIISRRPCALLKSVKHGKPLFSDPDKCVGCKACMRIGCPAISIVDGKAKVDATQCVGCGVCGQLCKFDALKTKED